MYIFLGFTYSIHDSILELFLQNVPIMQMVQNAILVDGLGLIGKEAMSQVMHTAISDLLQDSTFGAILSLLAIPPGITERI
jgi:hypothetical protein